MSVQLATAAIVKSHYQTWSLAAVISAWPQVLIKLPSSLDDLHATITRFSSFMQLSIEDSKHGTIIIYSDGSQTTPVDYGPGHLNPTQQSILVWSRLWTQQSYQFPLQEWSQSSRIEELYRRAHKVQQHSPDPYIIKVCTFACAHTLKIEPAICVDFSLLFCLKSRTNTNCN